MDPYRTLGVPRSCTREEVKEAFRARAPSAHPDHGGREFTFIQLRSAYDTIMAELDRRASGKPVGNRSARGRDDLGTETVSGPAAGHGSVGIVETSRDRRPRGDDHQAGRRAGYVAWFHRLSAKSAHRRPGRLRRIIDIMGATFLLYLAFLTPVSVAFFVAVQLLDLEKDARLAGWDTNSLLIVAVVAIQLGSFIPACLLVFLYGRRV